MPRGKAKTKAPVAGKKPTATTNTLMGIELPVRTGLSPAQQRFVPAIDNKYSFPEITFDVVSDILENRCVLTTGHAGTGKSSLFEQIAARMNQPCVRPVMNGQMTTSELLGGLLVRAGETVFVDGTLVRAMREGMWVIIDELDNADANILCSLNTVTEPVTDHKKDRDLILKENEGELVVAHPNFRILATANSAGCMEQFRSLYPGRNRLDVAFLSRFSVYHIDYLPAEQESEIVQAKTGIPAKIAANMVIIANQLRTAFANGEISAPCSTRQIFEWGRLIKRHIERAKSQLDFDDLSDKDREKTLKSIVQHAASLALKSRVSFEDQEVIDRLILMTFG